MTSALLLAALLASPVLADDRVPSTIEALYAEPDDPFFYGIPDLLFADVILDGAAEGLTRCLVDVGDVTGDGRPDVAAGASPGSAALTLTVRDGLTGDLVWGLSPGGGGFRSAKALDARDGRIVAGASSAKGRVSCLDAASGGLLWRRDLASPDPGGALITLHQVRLVDDLTGDGVDDVYVAAGFGLDGAGLLDGATGEVRWAHAAGDAVYAIEPGDDLDGDGRPDVLITGGDDAPFARMLSSATGAVLWSVALEGPGAVALALDDVDGDGTGDFAVGLWNAPGPCLIALSGDDGSPLWASSLDRDVTSLGGIGDLVGTGLHDVVVGSFDNALNGVLSKNGIVEWRREVSPNNTGAVLWVTPLADLDQSGQIDVIGVSQDHRAYLVGGDRGQYMAKHVLTGRGTAVAAYGDGDGDGRPEIALASDGDLDLISGASGTADGPEFLIDPPSTLAESGSMQIWMYPGTGLFVFASLTTSPLSLPAWNNDFGLGLDTLVLYFQGFAPGSGASGFEIQPLPVEAAGLTVYLQAASMYKNGGGWFSNVVELPVPLQ